MRQYDHRAIEKKWQKAWAAKKAHVTKDKVAGKKNEYLLVEFPYPSGNLHVGHWYAFAMPDIYARFRRAMGKNVLYPMGFDAFGLPAENAAIKHGLNPKAWTKKNIAYMKKQLASMGASFDWSREVATIDPEYYKWTQWQFLQFYKNGLAYQKETPANWCPKDKTVLANEQVVDGKCERCGSEVEQRLMLQWNLKITGYADRLIDDLTDLNWPEQIKDSQRSWIGRSEGAEIDFNLANDMVRRVVILHGRNGSPEDCAWQRAELESRGYEVQVPRLPNPQEPDDEEQAQYALAHCTFDEQTVIIGYSMGGIVAMRLLEKGVRVHRVTLVATPYTGVFLDRKTRKSVTKACQKGFDIATIRQHAKEFTVLADETDTVVPMADEEQLADRLGARLLRGRGEKPHFTGERERDILWAALPNIRVFTTRPDTLFGATYLVLAPEHELVDRLRFDISNRTEADAYIAQTKKKTELERQESKEKTGVELKGVTAVNPASGERIPVYIADYVLAGYGTGAIMAVPAHDERDFEFAKKYELPIKEVVEPTYEQTTEPGKIRAGEPFDHREAIIAAVQHWSEDKYIALKWKQVAWGTFVTGGIEAGQTPAEAAMMELREEVGFTDAEFVKDYGVVHGKFYHVPKKTNRNAHAHLIHLKLRSDTRVAVAEQEQAIHEVLWLTRDELKKFLTPDTHKHFLRVLEGQQGAYTADGTLTNSGEFDRLESAEARTLMTAKYGRAKKTYRLRDWGVSRQRYWGVPIPIIHCETCGAVPVPEKDLPVKLPDVKDYLPSGEGKSPLAKAEKWVNVKCPQCKGKAHRETDTLDTFVDSSWYFLRYTDPKNTKAFADKKKQDAWMPVDLYSGGAEHTTMHLLYSRFWHKALYDLKLVKEREPYVRRMNRGLILGPDGQKMSKSKGNVIDPDAVVTQLGADAVRLYLAFIGPYNEPGSYPWNPDSIMGVRRFLDRTWRLYEKVEATKKPDADVERELHKTIKKVGEDCAELKFNTAIAQMMIFLNAAEKGITKQQYATFVRVLAPFAPHISEELWSVLKQKGSVHVAAWPKYDKKKLVADTITIAVQINGKTRAEAKVPQGASKEDQEAAAHAAVADRLTGQTIQRAIVVPGRLVNFVVG